MEPSLILTIIALVCGVMTVVAGFNARLGPPWAWAGAGIILIAAVLLL